MARVRRTFTPQFKRDAVRLVEEGKTVSEVARDLGVARSLLQRWRDPSSSDPEQTKGSQGDSEEVRLLRKRLRDVAEERDILKKALAYFADDQK
jgi:transposase